MESSSQIARTQSLIGNRFWPRQESEKLRSRNGLTVGHFLWYSAGIFSVLAPALANDGMLDEPESQGRELVPDLSEVHGLLSNGGCMTLSREHPRST